MISFGAVLAFLKMTADRKCQETHERPVTCTNSLSQLCSSNTAAFAACNGHHYKHETEHEESQSKQHHGEMSYPTYYPTSTYRTVNMHVPQYGDLREMIKSNAAMVFPFIGKEYSVPEDFDIIMSYNVRKKKGFFGYTSRSYNASLVYGPHHERNIAAVGRAAKNYEEALDELLQTLCAALGHNEVNAVQRRGEFVRATQHYAGAVDTELAKHGRR
ncbi:hypothetical protein HII31_02332 [Pseudocercospora fuligena]|uniref:Uncharacterized protein n=1 Tax=Pseudocercospora fuligena TaxID=685502 RepID=A0A8H6VRJ4_9PEZI|nr:hypothetical protein HII31_02332 [Pseudocercospora fuligena]